ncbi:cytosine permease [Paenarthrobacter sp. RAF54_2]|uniref:purine-cytosine permease family protein n=1 Tax=Paenarthrobacter sp. RAF54_2 TaxID=3233061 RepID=UPI003F98229C
MNESEEAILRPGPLLDVSGADDPRVIQRQVHEEYTNHVVPATARLGKWGVFSGWSSIASAMAFLYYGALSASLVGVQQAIIGIVLVVVVYSALATKSAREAIRWGLNSTLLSRELFGFRGAALAPLLVASAGVYYAVFESSVLAVALQSYFQVWDVRVWYVIVIAGMLPLMLGGMQTWLNKLNGISLPVYFFGLVAAVVAAGIRFGWGGDWSAFQPSPPQTGIPGWLTVFVLYMGVWILFPDTQDAARFGRQADRKFHERVSFGWVFYLLAYLFNGLVGIFITALAASQDSVTESGVVHGVIASLGAVGLLVIVVSQIRINSANFYFASVNMERFVAHFSQRNLSRRTWVIVLLLMVLVLMFTNVFSYIAVALAWQAVLVVSWVGIMMVHWVLDRNTEPEFRPARLRGIAPGFGVWVVSSAAGIVLLQLPTQLPTLSALAPLVSLAASILLYAAVRLAGLSATRVLDADLLRDQIPDVWVARIKCSECDLSYVAFEMDMSRMGGPLCLDCQSRDRP